ncbi:MAG: hypothetical protein JW864_11305 [Spirochaetes bacterium]|nr:hypothetical protein [Spirochaetota bacterium]
MIKRKRIILIALISLVLIFSCPVIVINIWIGYTVEKNIAVAQKMYPGTDEDALIAFLLDEKNTTNDRTHIAVWTLGQIQSQKALPVLYKLYKNDPEGKTCYGRHDSVLCQYEIHKAIEAIEGSRE